MLITCDGITGLKRTENTWEDDDFVIAWKGLVFILGIAAGEASIAAFAQDVRTLGIVSAVKRLKGHYFMVVHDKKADAYYSFIDNSGAFDAFFSDAMVCTSFLELVKVSGLGRENVTKESIIEFLNFGNVYYNRTLVAGISKIDCGQIIVFCDHQQLILSKELEGLNEAIPQIDVLEFFRQFCLSIKDLKVSADLTGGVDSRLVCVLLDHFGLEFETAISGMEGIQDVEVPKEVAKKLKHSLHITEPCVEKLEQVIPELFVWSDGMNDLFKHYRTLQHHKNRVARGVNLVISGIGGEFVKENMWVQDFPFYVRKKSNVGRFLRMRMLQFKCRNAYFAGEFKELNHRFEMKVIKDLDRYVMDTNTKTYDNIYYNFRMKTVASRFISSTTQLFGCYSPFLEYDLVRYGFHLKRRERFFNQYHRRMITKLNAEVAKIRTAEGGISVSHEKAEMIKDIGKYIRNRCRRVTKVIGRKLFHKTYLQESAEHPELFQKIRGLDVTHKAISFLKREGILDDRLDISEIHDNHLGNMISLAMFLNYLERNEEFWIGEIEQNDRSKVMVG